MVPGTPTQQLHYAVIYVDSPPCFAWSLGIFFCTISGLVIEEVKSQQQTNRYAVLIARVTTEYI